MSYNERRDDLNLRNTIYYFDLFFILHKLELTVSLITQGQFTALELEKELSSLDDIIGWMRRDEFKETTCLLFLLFLLLFFVRWTIEFTRLVYEHTRKLVSVISLAQFIEQNFQELITAQNCLSFVERIAYFCTYQKRKDRVDYLELLYCEKLS